MINETNLTGNLMFNNLNITETSYFGNITIETLPFLQRTFAICYKNNCFFAIKTWLGLAILIFILGIIIYKIVKKHKNKSKEKKNGK